MNTTVHNVIVIGSGPAGLTAGLYLGRANLKPLIIEGKNPGGQLMGTSYVENWPGVERIMGPELMLKMRSHTQHFGATFLSQEIVRVDFSKRPFTLITNRNVELKAHSVIIATGAQPRRLTIPGEDTYWGKGVTTCAVCDGAFYPNKKVMIVGGGDTAMEDASFMTKFTSDITIVHILDKLTASHAMQERVINNPAIKIIYSSTLSSIEGDGSHVTQTTITNKITGEQTIQPVDAIFVAIGLTPNTQPFKGHVELTPYGYIKVIDQTKTSVPGVFVAGDVSDDRYRQAITSAGAGCMAALDTERYLQENSV